jgi:plastocyanin
MMKAISSPLSTIRLMTGLMLVFGLLLLPACGQDDTRTDDDTIVDDDFDLGLGTQDADTVEVRLSEFTIQMPQSLQAGRTVFRIVNDGTAQHGFEIEGPDVSDSLGSSVQPGEEATLSVDLEPGSYEVWCPVADHAEQGMRTTLQVTGDHSTDQSM